MTTPSQRLRAKLDLARPALRTAAAEFWTHPSLKTIFPDYLCAVHSVVRAAVPMLQLAAQRCRERAAGDACARALRDYYASHAEEEQHHDSWLLDDIESLGIRRCDVLERPPSASVASLVGAQYYWIENYHPVVFMAYLTVLEGPVDPEYYEEIIQRTGLPRDAFRMLLHHATVDVDHMQEVDAQLDRLPLTDAQERALGLNALATVGGLVDLFREVVPTDVRAPR